MGKIIITGAGRAGSTLVIRILSKLGFDCGFDPDNPPYVEEFRAGCEWQSGLDYHETPDHILRDTIAAGPKVMKSPDWSLWLKKLISRGVLEVDHIIVPFRDLGVAARSRLDAGLPWLIPEDAGDEALEFQTNVHAFALGSIVEVVLLWSIPITFMHFPMFAEDAKYCYACLSKIGDIDEEEFMRVHAELARPEQIVWT